MAKVTIRKNGHVAREEERKKKRRGREEEEVFYMPGRILAAQAGRSATRAWPQLIASWEQIRYLFETYHLSLNSIHSPTLNLYSLQKQDTVKLSSHSELKIF